jgi:hypothetical protein
VMHFELSVDRNVDAVHYNAFVDTVH